MRIPRFTKLSDLSRKELYEFKMRAKAQGLLPLNYNASLVANLYIKSQLLEFGFDQNTPLDEANTQLAESTLLHLIDNELLGDEINPLADLWKLNPELATHLTQKLFDDGYLTDDEIRNRTKTPLYLELSGITPEEYNESGISEWANSQLEGAKGGSGRIINSFLDAVENIPMVGGILTIPARAMFDSPGELDKDNTSLENFDKNSFGYYYDLAKKDLSGISTITDEQIKKEARTRYLRALNSNIFRGILLEINKYHNLLIAQKAKDRLLELNALDTNPQESNNISEQFDKIATGYEEVLLNVFGEETINHPGSNWYRLFKDHNALKDFSEEDQKDMLSKYLATREVLGELKAADYLDRMMLNYVREHREFLSDKVPSFFGNLGTTFGTSLAGNVALTCADAWGILGDVAYYLDGDTGFSEYCKTLRLALIDPRMSDGSSALDVIQVGTDDNGNPIYDFKGGFNARLSTKFLHKASTYNDWTAKGIQRAEENGGISRHPLYVRDPNSSGTTVGLVLADGVNMMPLILSQVAIGYFTGKTFGTYSKLNQANTAKAMAGVIGESYISTANVAAAYGAGAGDAAYNNAKELSDKMAFSDAKKELVALLSNASEYDRVKMERLTNYWKSQQENGNLVTDLLKLRDLEQYDQLHLNNIYERIKSERADRTEKIALDAYMTAYTTSSILESARMTALRLSVLSYLLSSPSKRILEQRQMATNYGKITGAPGGKVTNEGIRPLENLGIKKLVLKNPKAIGAYKATNAVIVGGGVSNMLDDYTTGYATGLALDYTNSALLREFDPEAYAELWYGDNELTLALHASTAGNRGLRDMALTSLPYHSFTVGVVGSIIGSPRIGGYSELRGLYERQNQMDIAAGKNISSFKKSFKKFRLEVNVVWNGGLWGAYEDARLGVNNLNEQIRIHNEIIDKSPERVNLITLLGHNIVVHENKEEEASLSDARISQDNLAINLLEMRELLKSNPVSAFREGFEDSLDLIDRIANDDVSLDERELLIQTSYGRRQQDKSKPLNDQRKAELWNDIKTNAQRFLDFASDYYEASNQLKTTDRSFLDPKNSSLLRQNVELIAKSKRVLRDIDNLSKELGITVDTSVTDRTQGELTETARKSSIKAAQETIEKLRALKQEAQEKINLLQEKQSLTLSERKELVKQKVSLTRADRAIPRLEAEITNLEEGTVAVLANSGLTTNVIQLHNMLSSPQLYTPELQGLINRFRTLIGELGVAYVEEMAKMQDLLNEMNDAKEALKANPEAFLYLVTGLQDAREDARLKAIYNTILHNRYNFLRRLPRLEIGPTSAVALTSEQFDLFIKEHPELSDTLSPYKEINTSFSDLNSLALEAVKAGNMDEDTKKFILSNMLAIAILDPEYIINNGNQGIADMMQFLIATAPDLTKVNAIKSLLTDFKRIASIQQSTIAYTEYRARKYADLLVKEAERVLLQEQEQAKSTLSESKEEVTDTASKDSEASKPDTEAETIKPAETEETKEESTEGLELINEPSLAKTEVTGTETELKTEELPAGVVRNSEGNLETMSMEQLAELLGITVVSENSMIDDSTPKVLETTNQQEEVHGCYFNPYDSKALNVGELVPMTEGHIYEWLNNEGINLGAIIDDELSNILKANSKILLMKVKRDGDDINVASNVFLVVEYTDKVSKHHLPENGGVITSNGKLYLIIGTMWNTKSLEGTEASNLMLATRNKLQSNGVEYFNTNPSERFYVDPTMNTEVTTFYSGHIVHTVDGESSTHTITELIDSHNKTHTSSDLMSMSDLGFGAITMKEGYCAVGPIDVVKAKKHKPLKYLNPSKYGLIYVLVPAANGEIVHIFINPTLLSEIKESELKRTIDTILIPLLLDEDYYVREQAISELCLLLCITGSITNPEGKGILIGKTDIPTVSLVNGKSVICTFDIKNLTLKYSDGRVITNPSIKDFVDAVYALNPRINLSLSNLSQPGWILRYDEAGALTTDAAKLGTFGGKYYVAPINPTTGQPIRVELKAKPVEVNSDYSRALSTPSMLPVGGKTYVLRNGKWVHLEDGSAVTDKAELAQVTWAYKVRTGEATEAKRAGNNIYYTMGIETSNPVVVVYDIKTMSYYSVSPELASLIIAEKRAEIEKQRADAEALRVLNQQEESLEVDTTKQSVIKAVESLEEVLPSTVVEEAKQTDLQEETAVKLKNDFELEQTTNQDKYSVDLILDSTDDAMMEYADKIFEIIESKIATSERWKDFDMSNITAELERLNIDTSNIEDVESWIDNLENCE